MPSKHSKNAESRSHFTYKEKTRSSFGSIKQRVSADSQLPFGYCPLTLYPIEDAVVSPSGRMYSREAILEYLLREMQELKAQQALYDQEQKLKAMKEAESGQRTELLQLQDFEANNLGIGGVVQRGFTEPAIESEHSKSRKRHIDDTDREEKLKSLKAVCPWVPQFTPSAPEAATKAPAKRPSSPFSGRPMRTKDLIPVSLIREESSDTSGPVRFICPVSRKTITNAKVVLIKSTGTLMLESSAKETSYKTMRDPLTNKPFTMDDVLELVPAASGFAASGSVEAKHYRPSMN